MPGSIHVKWEDWINDIRCENENAIGSLIDCGIPANPSYAELDVSHGTGLHSKARYTCQTGYHPVGKNVMACRTDGTWGYRDFQCIADPPRLLIEQHVYYVEYGNDVSLTCRIITAEPISTLQWEQTRIQGSPTIMDQSLWQYDSFTTELKITSATAQNNGTYRVLAANAGGTSYSDVVFLYVIGDLLNGSCKSCPSSFYCATKEAYNVCLRYLLYKDDVERSKEDFEETCIYFGAHLIQIDSEIKQNIVEEFLLIKDFPQKYIWIQGSYENGLWKFDDGTLMPYTNWDATEGQDPQQSYVVLRKDVNYRWRDAYRKPYRDFAAICEIRLT